MDKGRLLPLSKVLCSMQHFPSPDLVHYPGLILITDELSAPADFLLHRFLHVRLKEVKQSNCIFVSVSEDLERIRAVASKAVLNLPQNGRFKFIDLVKTTETTVHDGPRLRHIVDLISSELDPAYSEKGQDLVILDDISSLEWLGFSTLDLSRFARALKAACLKTGATLVVRHHILNASEPDPLCQLLLQLCSYHVEVRPLSSGRSGAVSGEVCLHQGASGDGPAYHLISRMAALQYRLTDGGAVFFGKGTSEGVL
ncbi:hypothetical protein ID866_1548 [Astraeus odoratus]|nr:hypothetical protein ID866_1548 [Astraeus odoratus]